MPFLGRTRLDRVAQTPPLRATGAAAQARQGAQARRRKAPQGATRRHKAPQGAARRSKAHQAGVHYISPGLPSPALSAGVHSSLPGARSTSPKQDRHAAILARRADRVAARTAPDTPTLVANNDDPGRRGRGRLLHDTCTRTESLASLVVCWKLASKFAGKGAEGA